MDGHEAHGTDGGDGVPVLLMALPAPEGADDDTFDRCLVDLVRVLGLGVARGSGVDDRRWGHLVRAALREACKQEAPFPEESFEVLLRAAVHDTDPSFNRWFVEAALNAFGRGRVRSRLTRYLRTGTDVERAGAARAWYWTALPLKHPHLRATGPGGYRTEPDDGAAAVREWNEAALREFVDNERLDVRRCILPGLPLRPSAYPAQLHRLVEEAVAIARSHPDPYLRHRVEHQVRG
ncbi:hypothetical protein [Kitasatospora herbaricolor]|uniref:Uncharacterized protein n=1 Tax=Kitasatospora herbaricolor TaxID=68217 RepID=A0ABZ1WK62_9ACTN|nr:hypothetical protein [Kitasatospora herbaricolor]